MSQDTGKTTDTITEENKEITNQNVEQDIENGEQDETSSVIDSNITQSTDNLENTVGTDDLYTTESEIVTDENTRNIDNIDIGILSVSGIFLVFVIIFLITFMKHKQKHKNKMSK